MKKYYRFVSITVCVCALFACVCVAYAAQVIYLEGSCQVRSPQDESWRKLDKDARVDIGDSIRTARHSKIDIALDAEKKNMIRLGERTLVVLSSSTETSVDRLDLSRGRVYSNMENIKAGLSFEVNTPSAVAGVRGSSYMVYTERDQDEVSAYKDTVFIKTFDADKNLISEVMLPQGFKTFIERFEAAGALIQVHLREFERFDAIREALVSRAAGQEPREQERERFLPDPEPSILQDIRAPSELTDQLMETKELTGESKTEQLIEERIEGVHQDPTFEPTFEP